MACIKVAENLYAIDLFEERHAGRSSAYVILGREPILIETGSANSHDALLTGLAEVGINPEDIRHIVITHVHLDHAGGVGQMMERCSAAILHCHPRAARHVIDPSRLVAGATSVYGSQLEEIFGPVVAVPKERVVTHEDESVLSTGDRELVFYDTPGHAKHHICVWDEATRGIFSGDMIGIRYQPAYTGWDFVYGFPTTTPSDFDPDVMWQTLDRLQALPVQRIYHTHFGVTEPAQEAFQFSRRGLGVIQRILPDLSVDTPLSDVIDALKAGVVDDLAALGHPSMDVAPLGLDIMLNSQGILVYLQKKAAGKL